MDTADKALLEADDWFGALPAERRKLLLDNGRPRSFGSGELIYAIGEPPNGLWAVVSGQVRLKGYPAAGLEFLALILRPGTWFGEVSTLDGGPRPHDAVAFGPTRMLHVPMAAFRRLAQAEPGFHRDLGLLVCRHQRVALDFIAQTVAVPLQVRLARLLSGHTREPGQAQEVGQALNVRQEDLAVMLSVARQTLNKHLQVLAQAGVIGLAYAQIRVLDPGRLAKLAASDG